MLLKSVNVINQIQDFLYLAIYNAHILGSSIIFYMLVILIPMHNNSTDNCWRGTYIKVIYHKFFKVLTVQLGWKALARFIRATGTVRENRTNGAHAKLMVSKELKKKGMGHIDFVSDGQIYTMKWNDNSVVMMSSNHLTHEPVQQTTCRVKGASNVSVQQPFIVRQYNVSTGGVDLINRLLSSYHTFCGFQKGLWFSQS